MGCILEGIFGLIGIIAYFAILMTCFVSPFPGPIIGIVLLALVVSFFRFMRPSKEQQVKLQNRAQVVKDIKQIVDTNGGFREINCGPKFNRINIYCNNGTTHVYSFSEHGYDTPSRETVDFIIYSFSRPGVLCHETETVADRSPVGYSISSSGNISPNYAGGANVKLVRVYRVRSKEYYSIMKRYEEEQERLKMNRKL